MEFQIWIAKVLVFLLHSQTFRFFKQRDWVRRVAISCDKPERGQLNTCVMELQKGQQQECVLHWHLLGQHRWTVVVMNEKKKHENTLFLSNAKKIL